MRELVCPDGGDCIALHYRITRLASTYLDASHRFDTCIACMHNGIASLLAFAASPMVCIINDRYMD